MRKQNGVEFRKSFLINVVEGNRTIESFQLTNSKKYGLYLIHATYAFDEKVNGVRTTTCESKTISVEEYNEYVAMYDNATKEEGTAIIEVKQEVELNDYVEEVTTNEVYEVIENSNKKVAYKVSFANYYKLFVWDKVIGKCYHEKYKNGTYAEYHAYKSYPAWDRALANSIRVAKHRRGVN